jgi:hypothetical protein
LQALVKAKQEKSVNGSTPNTIAVMSAKSLADQYPLSDADDVTHYTFFFYFSPFYQPTNIKVYYRYPVFNTALAKSFSKTALDGTVLLRACK